MPKKKSLWKRETKCLVCETQMINYQYMTKSQNLVLDEWMVSHTQPVGEYDDFPEVLKTTICPACLIASNEYSFGVDQYKYFYRNLRKNDLLKELFMKTMEERFRVLAEEIGKFEKESMILDQKNNRPVNTRTRATFEKIWRQKERYGVPFFNLMFSEPRDHVMALACYAVDRYCQYVRIAFNFDVEPPAWDYKTLKSTLEDRFTGKPLDIKSTEPRFYFIGNNYLQSIQYLEELNKTIYSEEDKQHQELIEEYWQEAYKTMQLSLKNDDMASLPNELKEGGMYLLLARLHYRFHNIEEGDKILRYAKNYADTRLRQISSRNQQQYVNDVEDLVKVRFGS